MEKYIKTRNNPPTPQELELLICLNEEATEVAKEVCKIQRSGKDHAYPIGNATNLQRLHNEIGDFLAILDRLILIDLINETDVLTAQERKNSDLDFFLLESQTKEPEPVTHDLSKGPPLEFHDSAWHWLRAKEGHSFIAMWQTGEWWTCGDETPLYLDGCGITYHAPALLPP